MDVRLAQHYVECSESNCDGSVSFYCKTCQLSLCDACKTTHKIQSENHKIVPYLERRTPSVICAIHGEPYIACCENCELPICDQCLVFEHYDHKLCDTSTMYTKVMETCDERIMEYHRKANVFGEESDAIKNIMDKNVVSIRQAIHNCIENTMKEINQYLETRKNEIDIHLVKISQYEKCKEQDPENFLIFCKANEIENLQLEDTAILKTVGNDPLFSKRLEALVFKDLTLSQVDSQCLITDETSLFTLNEAEEVFHFVIKDLAYVGHIVCVTTLVGMAWVSDGKYLLLVDEKGYEHKKFKSRRSRYGFHSALNEELLSTGWKEGNVIRKVSDGKISVLAETEDWTPVCIHYSTITKQIIAGMTTGESACVSRYNIQGHLLQRIFSNLEGQELYKRPNYITVNNNGDIWVSDMLLQAVIVVNKIGTHRFNYRGVRADSEASFHPCGICHDALSNIIVCGSDGIHIIDRDGQFIKLLLTKENGVQNPSSVSVDSEGRLWVGQFSENTVSVWRYLK